jgi:hypothetical protein
MPQPYEKNKIHVYKWRENNREKLAIMQHEYNIKRPMMRWIHRKETWKQISKTFLKILL